MKVQDAIAEDKRRGGKGVARHKSGDWRDVMFVDGRFLFAGQVSWEWNEHSLVTPALLVALDSADWEPVTPEPVPEPEPEWEEWGRTTALPLFCEYGPCEQGMTWEPESVGAMAMPDGSPRFGGWVFPRACGEYELRFDSHVLFRHADGTLIAEVYEDDQGHAEFAHHARMRKLPEEEK